ncbi:MAG: efflux RND transporter periplasmic adaptor subunit [Planctomycetota bacterium]
MNRACRMMVAFALLVGIAAPSAPAQGPPPAKVRFDGVRTEVIDQYREVTGELRAARSSRVAAQEEGLVLQFPVEVGQRIERGEVIARLDAELREIAVRRLEAELEASSATIDERVAQLERAERDYKRLEDAARMQGVNRVEVDNAGSDVSAARARLSEARAAALGAEARLAEAQRRLRDMTIVAPFTGVVFEKRTDVGEWLGEGDTIVRLIATDTIDAYLEVPQQFLAACEPGKTVQLRVTAVGGVIDAPVAAILPQGDELARTFPVRVRMPEGSGVRPGMSVTGLVPTGSAGESMTIHKDALLRNDVGNYVFIDAGGLSAVAPVQVLFASGERLAIRSPRLEPGMRVVIEGNERMFPGQPLMDLDAAPPTAPPAEQPQSERG